MVALAVSLLVGNSWQESWIAASSRPVKVAQEAVETAPPAATELGIAGNYEDPQGNFQVGLLEGYAASSVAGSPLFQNSDGSLAYSVIRVPLASETRLSEIGLVEIAQKTLGQGEGFQTQTFNTVPDGGVQIDWNGRLSEGAAPPQPISGTILAKQQGAAAYLIVVAALDAVVEQVPDVVSTLAGTLVVL
ncbi:MAG: hypothetical protein AAFX51_17110 [Cyanobacteria bacterium J06636_28]